MKIVNVVCCLSLLLTQQVFAANEGLMPELGLAKGSASVYGYGQVAFEENTQKETTLERMRIRFDYSFGNSTIYSEVDAADEDNWLREMWVSYKANNTNFRLGRLFVAAGMATPPPFLLKTVKYPLAVPFSAYAYGGQVDFDFGSGLTLGADITGTSGKVFNDDANWDSVEMSSRLVNKTNNTQWAFTAQLAKETRKFGIDIEHDATERLWLNGGVYAVNSNKDTTYNTYVLANWVSTSSLHFHSRLDYRENNQSGDDMIWTNGLQWFPNKIIAITSDYQSALKSPSIGDALMVRLQVRF